MPAWVRRGYAIPCSLTYKVNMQSTEKVQATDWLDCRDHLVYTLHAMYQVEGTPAHTNMHLLVSQIPLFEPLR